MKSQVLLTVWCHISCEAAGEFWHWSLSGVKGLTHICIWKQSVTAAIDVSIQELFPSKYVDRKQQHDSEMEQLAR